MRSKLIISIAGLAVLAAATAWAQAAPWEVRTYVSPTTNYSGSYAYCENMGVVRKQYISPNCGYSSSADGTCPDPWGAGTSGDDLVNAGAPPLQRAPLERIVSLFRVGDDTYPMGRAFHPGGVVEPDMNPPNPALLPWLWDALKNDPENIGSFVTSRAAGLSTLVAAGEAARFLVVQPGAARAAASTTSKFVVEEAGDPVPAGLDPDDWVIHVNPYRVANGDTWYIRQHEATQPGPDRTTELTIEVYSKLYGLDFSMDAAVDPVIDLDDFWSDGGCTIITNSGALRIECPRVYNPPNRDGTWVIEFTIVSNTQTLPCPEEVDYDDVAGAGDLYPTLSEPNPDPDNGGDINCAFPPKEPWMLVSAPLNGYVGTDLNVVEKSNGSFTTDQCWPYRIPPGAVGLGQAMVQWCYRDDSDTTLHEATQDSKQVYYKTGWEWHYLADLDVPGDSDELVTNEDVATRSALSNDSSNYEFVDCHFMSTGLNVPPTGDEWVHSSGTSGAPPIEPAASCGYTRMIVGEGADPMAAGSTVGGEYNPGSSTPERPFYAGNRVPEDITVCPVKSGGCGAHFLVSEHGVGSACPNCGVALVKETAQPELHYDALQPPTVECGGERYSIAREAIKFSPSNDKVRIPLGWADFPQTVRIDIPRYQPPSVPAGATGFENDIDSDPGYVGTMRALDGTPGSWEAYYQAPNDGHRQLQAGANQGSGGAELHCPVCDARFSTTVGGPCAFCGETLAPAPGAQVPESCLMCDQYDLFELQVSVNRKVELACDQPVVDLGWVAPGVPQDQPNTVSTTMATGTVPWPVDVSQLSNLVPRNEGNILTEPTVWWPYLYRGELDKWLRSPARNGQSVPVTRQTLLRFVPGGAAFPDPWALGRQEAGAAGGMAAGAMLRAGVRSGTIKPVPLGQGLGNYYGQVLVYADIDGDGQLDFFDSEIGLTSTAAAEFDPDVDRPSEPVAAFSARMRVVESRLPHSDFYSRDLEPTAVFDPDAIPTSLQVVWEGNRLSAQTADPSNQDEADAGTGAADVPAANDPFNILYANAGVTVADNGLYRGWLWQRAGGDLVEAKALTGEDAIGVVNASPTVYLDEDAAGNDRWVMWHRRLATAAGVDAQLRFDSSGNDEWTGSSANEFIYGSDPARFGLTGFAGHYDRTQVATAVHWLFWHTGPKGRESIRYRWNFDPTAAVVTSNEGPLPVSNAVAAGKRSDVWYRSGTVHPSIVATAAQDGRLGYRKPSHSPFTYVKDPSVFEHVVDDGTTSSACVHVFFAGYVRAAGNSDICWVKFNDGVRSAQPSEPPEHRMQKADENYGKITFPRVADNDPYMPVEWANGATNRGTKFAGEELQSDGRRHNFSTAHLDWLVSDDTQDGDGDDYNFATKPDPVPYDPVADEGGHGDPQFYLAFVTNDGSGPRQHVFSVYWTEGRYGRSSGTYLVTPRLEGMIIDTGPVYAQLPPNVGHKSGTAPSGAPTWALLDPHVRRTMQAGDDPDDQPSVRIRMDPAAGTIRWSASLFNPDNPADPLAVFNTDNTPDLVDVVMYADYTPYIMRITTDDATDDSPSAFYDLGGTSRLTVFWRRSYSSTDTPHFGRTDFIHKTWTMALQVARPPIASVSAITDLTPSPNQPVAAANYTVDARNGIITLSELSRIGHVIRVEYTSATSAVPQTEYHRIIGWSKETPVPVDTVVSEGKLDVMPETYTIPDGLGGTGTVDLVRYWLFWSSPRATYDVRDSANDGQRVHQSSDVYCAVVAPEYGSLIREANVPRIGP